MLVAIIVLICIVVLFALSVNNHIRMETVEQRHKNLLAKARIEINALNTVLLTRFKRKSALDSSVLHKMHALLSDIQTNMDTRTRALSAEIDELQKTLTRLYERQHIQSALMNT
jgi:predicted  nucleic acid-binding Zn-ribbon protein